MKIIPILLFLLLSCKASAQGLYEDQQRYALLRSGKSKVKAFTNEKLTSVWHIDSAAKTVSLYALSPNLTGPKYDNAYSITYLKKYTFTRAGHVQSILMIDYHPSLPEDGQSSSGIASDTTEIIYSYSLSENQPINRKKYVVNQGQKRLIATEYFGYDSQQRLILLIQDEGAVQFHYSYNKKGEIEKETVLDAVVRFQYNTSGQIITRTSEDQQISYEYNAEHLLIRKTVTGNHAETLIYRYE